MSEYTDLLEDARRHAIDRMVANAKLLGANGIVAMRFDSSEMGNQLTEVVAYGTAVVVTCRRLSRSGVAALLGRHFAEDRLDADELDRRLDLAFAGSSDALAGLPPLARTRHRSGAGAAATASPARPIRAGCRPRSASSTRSTQRVMRVWVDPADHSRHYVPEP